MSDQTINELRAHLEAEYQRLEAEVATIEREGHEALSEASGENNYRDHMADQGSATFARELDMTIDETVRDAFDAVTKALRRMNEGTYQACERCSQPISIERLQAIPTATLCITCKSAEESR